MSLKLNKFELLARGIYVQNATSTAKLTSLIRRLCPIRTSIELTRVGSIADGGYLVPHDLEDISACFSPGVGPTASFEADLLERYNIPSHLCDFSVESPPDNFKPLSFERRFVGAYDDETFTTMNSWMERKSEHHSNDDLLLQMDIEGAEYIALLNMADEKLRRFRVIAIEFHHIEHWADSAFFDIVEAVFSKLLKDFYVVHIHPNNYGRLIKLAGIIAPEVFEISLIRKDRCDPLGVCEEFPHPLDRPCNPARADLALPIEWYTPAPTVKFSQKPNRAIFNRIYKERLWADGNDRQLSGPGSHKTNVIMPYIAAMKTILKTLRCETLVDLGCGDLNVGQYFLSECRSYIACDVSDSILERNRKNYTNSKLTFKCLDISTDKLPHGDIAFVRQVLQHLSNSDIASFVESVNFFRPFRYLVLTEHVPKFPDFTPNIDMKTGGSIRLFSGSGVDLDKPPFQLSYRSINTLLEIDEPVNEIPATIRTQLFELY